MRSSRLAYLPSYLFAIAATMFTTAPRPARCFSANLIRQKRAATHAAMLRRHRPAAASSRTATARHTSATTGRGDGDGPSSWSWYQPSLVDHMLYRIREVNDVPYDVRQSLVDFAVSGRVLGRVTPKVAERLSSSGPVFELSTGTNKPTLTLSNAAGTTVEQRTRSVASVMERFRDEGYITGWRDELYPVAESFDSPPTFLIERAAASLLGVLEYGVHINGLCEVNENETRMWMARRSKTKSKFPGFLDHIVAGGQPAGLSLMDNVVKECAEEAGIPPEITRRGIRPAGAISYETYEGALKNRGEGAMSRVVLFCFDLTLPGDFVPTAVDGEVESFFTWSLEEIGASMDPEYNNPIKPNCYLGEWSLYIDID